jgi:uncharacterized protein YkwD
VAALALASLWTGSTWALPGAAAAGQTFTYTSSVTYGRPSATPPSGPFLGLLGGEAPTFAPLLATTGQATTGGHGLVTTPTLTPQLPAPTQAGGPIGLAAVMALLNGGLAPGGWSGGIASGGLTAGTGSPAPTTPPEPAPSGGSPTTCAPSAGQAAYVLCLVNAQRALVGAPPLVLDPTLTAIAQRRASVLAASGTLTHDIPGLGYALDMERAAGVTGTLLGAEDLATGASAYQAFWMLMTSDWHRANLLYASYNTAGIALAPMAAGTQVLDILFVAR